MNSKMVGVLVGVAGLIAWFTPFVYVNFMGVAGYQSGQHIGGIAYLLLLTSAAYAVLSWQQQHRLAAVSAGISAAICGLFAVQAGADIGWGLISLLILSVVGVVLSLRGGAATGSAVGV